MFLLRDLVSARTWLAMTQHLAGLFVGFVAIFVFTFGLGFGFSFVFLGLIGIPLLGITLRLASWFARAERARFAFLLGVAIPVWPEQGRAGYRWGIIPRWRMFREKATWAEVGYGLLRLPVSAVALTLSVGVWAAGLVALTLPAYSSALPGGGPDFGGGPHSGVQSGAAFLAGSAILGAALLLAAPQVTRGLALADAAISRRLLGPRGDLAARVMELEISRERVVDAAEAERRRIERDLHDGAQQRLVALAMELGRAKAKFADDPDAARELVDQAHAQAKEALTELRNLVRGVHPPVLTDRGLDAALSGLVALCPVPVDMHVDVPVRPKAAVEAVAYFVVAEALTNVAKHSRASHAKVVVEGHGFPGTLTVMVSDDGIGGADPHSPGLSGLADRVSGVDGRFSVESPVGGPTIIAAVLPCA
ncbi:MAG TPA: sensor domain-containing protein [Streptosporangiaceae bacterium]|nr:sensor domain-containing protein [Streptosporangiaceae bacterium]